MLIHYDVTDASYIIFPERFSFREDIQERARIEQGLDGFFYIVFPDTDGAWDYMEEHGGRIACMGGYENAVCLHETLGV